MLKIPEPWDTCWGKLLTGSGTSPGESSFKNEKVVDNWRLLWHQPWRCRVWSLPSWFPVLLWGLQLSDWMNLRRDLELWTFNIVETAMTMRTLKVGLNTFCIMLCLSMPPPIDSCVWTSLWGPTNEMWWFVYSWTREWHHLEVWPCWTRCVTLGVGFKTLILAAWKSVFC